MKWVTLRDPMEEWGPLLSGTTQPQSVSNFLVFTTFTYVSLFLYRPSFVLCFFPVTNPNSTTVAF
jgi:hypothetical protein